MKFIFYIITVVLLAFTLKLLFDIYRSIKLHKKRSKRIEEWSSFNKLLISYTSEITDSQVKSEYISHCMRILTSEKSIDFITSDHAIQSIENEIIEKFSNHIPSLKQKSREKKLNRILN